MPVLEVFSGFEQEPLRVHLHLVGDCPTKEEMEVLSQTDGSYYLYPKRPTSTGGGYTPRLPIALIKQTPDLFSLTKRLVEVEVLLLDPEARDLFLAEFVEIAVDRVEHLQLSLV